MMQRFTDDAQRVLSLAQEAALELGHDYVGTEHVLIGLTKVKNSVIRIAEPIISGICDGKDNKPSKKNNKICII